MAPVPARTRPVPGIQCVRKTFPNQIIQAAGGSAEAVLADSTSEADTVVLFERAGKEVNVQFESPGGLWGRYPGEISRTRLRPEELVWPFWSVAGHECLLLSPGCFRGALPSLC